MKILYTYIYTYMYVCYIIEEQQLYITYMLCYVLSLFPN